MSAPQVVPVPQVTCTYTVPETSSRENPAAVSIEVFIGQRIDESLRVVVAPASLCVGWHKLTWILTGVPATITGFGLLSAVPQKVFVIDNPEQGSSGEWTAIVQNEGVSETSGLQYAFTFALEDSPHMFLTSGEFIHDPTIAVTKDPLDPP
jgi:hypothetical protein